jgi:hypothetical protein
MKKLLLLMVLPAIFLLHSCSGTEEKTEYKPSVVKATIDGVPYVFNTVNIQRDTFGNGDESWTDITVTASIDNDPSFLVSFIVTEHVLGPDASWFFAYFLDDTAYPKMDDFIHDVTFNNGNTIKGTFWGHAEGTDEIPIIAGITDGSYEIHY